MKNEHIILLGWILSAISVIGFCDCREKQILRYRGIMFELVPL